MDIRTPPPFMVVDVTQESWAHLVQHQQGYDQFVGWLIEQGFDPNDVRRIEIYDRDSPLVESPVWAKVTNGAGETRVEALGTCPPMRVRMIIGVYPQGERIPGKSDILFKNGHVDDPAPPFPSLSPREIAAQVNGLEAEMQNAQRAQFAYEAHAIAHGAIDLFGAPLYRWDEISNCCRQAWEAATAALTAEIRGEQVVRETLAKSAEQAEALGALAKALDALPERCPYHGSNTDPKGYPYPWTREACCDTGKPAQRRKRAEEALAMLRAGLADV
ncbi:hypothetical protein ACQEVF_59470 [Nonomuraea polychroma]|uniref:hypothetical protein n=1 Tax=Nonomuraea polychroma TaxID=46176 RepID=UPI003D91AC74